MMSLLGLSLAIGILIDDAIVVRENIVRHVEMGADHMRAAHEGTDEIGLAVTATTFSIVAVFVPVGFMPGIAGQWFKPFALTIAAAVLVSLFVSFSLDPMLSAYWPDPQLEAHERRNPIARTLERFNRWFDRQADRYKGVIALGARSSRGSMVALAAVSFVARDRAAGRVRRLRLRAAERQQRVEHRDRDAAGLEPRVHDAQGRGSRADRSRSATPKCCTPTRPSAARRARATVDNASIYVRLVPKTAARDQPGRISGRSFARRCANVGGATAYTYASRIRRHIRSSCSSSFRVPIKRRSISSPSRSQTRARRRRARSTSAFRRADRSRSSTCR